MSRCARCLHDREDHTWFRRGIECGQCWCPKYRPMWRDALQDIDDWLRARFRVRW